MNNSVIEQDFINWCNQIHPDINPYIFIHRHIRYSEEYLPLIEETSTEMYNYVKQKKPNANFSLKGRIKSKRSFLIKSFVTMAKNIEAIFNNKYEPSEREKMFSTYFKFLSTDNPEKYNEIKKIAFNLIPTFDDFLDSFSIIFNKLSQEEKNKLVSRLGRTEDTYAYRLIVHSVDFPIKSIDVSSDSDFYIIDQDGNKMPINIATSLNPDKDIILSEENDKNYISINGKKEILNERNLLYPSNLPYNQQTLQNAQKDENGNVTLLNDSFIFNDTSHLNIIDIKINPTNHSFFITDSNGEVRNISSLLEKGNLKLKKCDEEALIKEVYDIYAIIQDFYKTHEIQSIQSRQKDYIANPKPITEYMSIHDSAIHTKYGYTLEGQDRTLKMDDDSKDESTRTGHDVYKKSKREDFLHYKILQKVLSQNPNAFDSSISTLMKILENGNVELSEILGKYILTTTMSNGVATSYQPPIDIVFKHIFHNTSSLSTSDSNDSLPKLDFSSYENFIASRKSRNHAIENESIFPDIYDD